MTQTDTIKTIRDSILSLPATRAGEKIDTAADSVKPLPPKSKVHITKVVVPPSGFVGTPRPSLPHTESWIFVAFLLVFIVLVVSRAVTVVYEAAKSFFQVKERISIFNKTTISDLRTKLLMVVYPILVFSLYAFFIYHKPNKEYELIYFGYFFALFSLFFLLKYVLMTIVGYVFVDVKSSKMFKENYFNVVVFTSFFLFPFLVVRVYASDYLISVTELLSVVICVFSSGLIIFKLFQIFLDKTVVTFYILLYLCTLEILPIFGLIKLIGLMP
jgi:hypothetical protein